MLSRSILLMFLYDFAVILFSTSYFYQKFNLPNNFLELIIPLTLVAGLAINFLKGYYKIREFNISKKNGYLLFEACIFSQIPALILLLIFSRNLNSLFFLISNTILIYFGLRIYRVLFHLYLFKIKKDKNILVIGTNQEARLIADEIMNKKALRMNVIGFVQDDEDEVILKDSSTKIFNKNDLANVAKENNIQIVIVAIKRRMEESLLTNMVNSIPNSVKIYKMADFYEKVTGKYYINKMSINWLYYDFMNKRSKVYDFCKRAFDIISALIILTVTAPILVYIGYRVKKTDGGPAIYTQNRVGKGGKIFKAYKLRTMYLNDYVPKSGQFKHAVDGQDNDSRVIPFCKIIRKARLDEIPQMINILRGEMSIVGPRCEWDDLVNIYSKEIPFYPCRQWIKTGWTGWAQINQGHCVLNDDIAEKLQYDLYYLKHRNVLWEIGILIKAVFLALGGRHG